MRDNLGVATLKSLESHDWEGKKKKKRREWKMKFGVHSSQHLHIAVTLCDLRYCSYFLCRYQLPFY